MQRTFEPVAPITLRQWRHNKGLTIQEAADWLEMPLTTYYAIERGHQVPRRALMEHLSARTGVSKAVLAQVA
jgi:DNA-binding XRE family transcriptional regulator